LPNSPSFPTKPFTQKVRLWSPSQRSRILCFSYGLCLLMV
jgi:hypothetical protein